MLGRGIPLIPGARNSLTLGDLPSAGLGPLAELSPELLEAAAKGFLQTWSDLFPIDLSEWQLNPDGTLLVDDDRLQYISLVRNIGDVPVDGSRMTFSVKEGNLIYLHATFLENIAAIPTPSLTAADALGSSLAGVSAQMLRATEAPSLQYVPVPDVKEASGSQLPSNMA